MSDPGDTGHVAEYDPNWSGERIERIQAEGAAETYEAMLARRTAALGVTASDIEHLHAQREFIDRTRGRDLSSSAQM